MSSAVPHLVMKTIVLAHGILGFGDVHLIPNYFNGVKDHLEGQGHRVYAPGVNPIGRVAERGRTLADAIREIPGREKDVHVIAHSMGGLDARYAIVREPGVVERVKTLVTIGTPHRGSPVADAILRGELRHLPDFITDRLNAEVPALRDLATDADDIQSIRDDPGHSVTYVNVAGDAARASHASSLFRIFREIGQFSEINDGVVGRSSALLPGHRHLDDWPVDHGGEVGWNLDLPVPVVRGVPLTPAHREHLARYDAIVSLF